MRPNAETPQSTQGFPLSFLFLKSMHSFDGKHCTKCLTVNKLSNYVFSSLNYMFLKQSHNTQSSQHSQGSEMSRTQDMHWHISPPKHLRSKPLYNAINPIQQPSRCHNLSRSRPLTLLGCKRGVTSRKKS